jgi:adhesin/invasin
VVNAVVNGASFAGNGIVPGEIATIFGNNLTGSIGINGASSLPLPTTLTDVSVLINDQPVPLLAVANVSGGQQINFEVPWELEGRSTATLAVNNGVTGSAISVPVVSTQPGIFSYNIGSDAFGAILHANFQLVDIVHPATANEIVLIYCTGLGAVSSPPASGAASNAQPTVVTPTVHIGVAFARVIFSGLAPGFAGLNQVNVEVPPGLTPGNQPVVITVSGASSNPVLLPVN